MQLTKCDLCSETMSLDYLALHRGLMCAVGLYKNELNRLMNEWDDFNSSTTTRSIVANRLATAASNFAILCELWHTVSEGLTREKKKFVNVPQIPQERKE